MSAHTPGPWGISKDGYGVYYVNPRIEAGEDIDDPQHDSVIARVDGGAVDPAFFGMDDDTMRANASLIAAAPELLAALTDLREACAGAYKAGRIPAEPFVRAGNVIAKASA